MSPALAHQRLLECLSYDPDTGLWRWIKSNTNSVEPGDLAGSISPPCGRRSARRVLMLDGVSYQSSHLAFFYMTASWPVHEMDHINGNSIDDSWENLRHATRNQNEINKGPYKNNRLGVKGVYRRNGKYLAFIHRNYKRQALGRFLTIEEASSAYIAAAKAHDREFARI